MNLITIWGTIVTCKNIRSTRRCWISLSKLWFCEFFNAQLDSRVFFKPQKIWRRGHCTEKVCFRDMKQIQKRKIHYQPYIAIQTVVWCHLMRREIARNPTSDWQRYISFDLQSISGTCHVCSMIFFNIHTESDLWLSVVTFSRPLANRELGWSEVRIFRDSLSLLWLRTIATGWNHVFLRFSINTSST